jgi:hypothetical protein
MRLPLLLGRINPSSRVAGGRDRITPASTRAPAQASGPPSAARIGCGMMGRFETGWLTREVNLAAQSDPPNAWIDRNAGTQAEEDDRSVSGLFFYAAHGLQVV